MPPPITLDQIRNTRPVDRDHLWHWVHKFTGVRIAREKVCRAHQPPFEFFADWHFLLSGETLVLGPRGGGKSFLSALDTHCKSRWHPGYGTRILGGSLTQSHQIYQALRETVYFGNGSLGSDADTILRLLKTEAQYRNGSDVSILAASTTSVRGPHVPSLRLDEVDEIEDEIREAAYGMASGKKGQSRSTISMTSTWHKLGGAMGKKIEEAKETGTPFYSFCSLDVIERCPEERSGCYVGGDDLYERCSECPIRKWCHGERDLNGNLALAKIADGHYLIDDVIQKVKGVSLRTFEADYLCKGPKAGSVWFKDFDAAMGGPHVSAEAIYQPLYAVHLSVDSGVWTGAVWLQVKDHPDGGPLVDIFAELLTENAGAEANGLEMVAISGTKCQGRRERVSTDPTGNSKNPVGRTVLSLYEAAGLKPAKDIVRWSHRAGTVKAGLDLVEAMLRSADGTVRLRIHPSCVMTIKAFQNYARAKANGVLLDVPEPTQHPWEDLMDAVRGGIYTEFPQGILIKASQPRASMQAVFK